jgi:hypothetical protein
MDPEYRRLNRERSAQAAAKTRTMQVIADPRSGGGGGGPVRAAAVGQRISFSNRARAAHLPYQGVPDCNKGGHALCLPQPSRVSFCPLIASAHNAPTTSASSGCTFTWWWAGRERCVSTHDTRAVSAQGLFLCSCWLRHACMHAALQQGERPKKKFERGQFERRARMEKDALESLLFRLFERQVCVCISLQQLTKRMVHAPC